MKWIFWVLALFFCVLAVLLNSIMLHQDVPGVFAFTAFVLFPLGLVSFLATVLFLVLVLWLRPSAGEPRGRRWFLGALVVSGTWLISWVTFTATTDFYGKRRQWIEATIEKYSPVVHAIEQYETKYGHPPASLDALVPEFLETRPDPSLRYYRAEQWQDLLGVKAQRWAVRINCPWTAPFNFDTLIYEPEAAYPKPTDVCCFELVDGWAYFED